MPAAAKSVVVVGAGIVGAAIAHALQRRGRHVALVDRGRPGHGCSYGNAGALSEASVAPLAMPGIARSVPAMLRDPAAPLYLPAAYLPRALPWLLRFLRTAQEEQVRRAASSLAALNRDAGRLHAQLAADVGAPELVRTGGHLHLYPDAAALAKDAAVWALRERMGACPQRLDRAGILALEPAIGSRYTVGLALPGHAFITNPRRYVECIVATVLARGGTFVEDEVLALENRSGQWRVRGCSRELVADDVVVAAGAWANRLLAPLGEALPLEAQRGYHATFTGVGGTLSRVVVLADRKAFITPMEEGLRIAGTVEFGGVDRPPDYRRADLLARLARETLPGLGGATYARWMGHRPCLPDSLPRIGRVERRRGLWLAVGHGHLGLTQAVATAERIADAFDAG